MNKEQLLEKIREFDTLPNTERANAKSDLILELLIDDILFYDQPGEFKKNDNI